MIDLYFENIADYRPDSTNFINCNDINSSGLRRFGASPFIKLHGEQFVNKYISEIPDHPLVNYIISIGVGHSPSDWCGATSTRPDKLLGRKNVFAHLDTKHFKNIQQKKAFVLLDQSHEGYSTEWLWEWFHQSCIDYGIPPSQIIYITGDLNVDQLYTRWADENNIKDRIAVFAYTHFEYVVSGWMSTPRFSPKKWIRYKRNNPSEIYDYNCLQKRTRAHRTRLFLKLYEFDLLKHGINSMNKFSYNDTCLPDFNEADEHICKNAVQLLPMYPPNTSKQDKKVFKSGDCGFYLTTIDTYSPYYSWLTVISEASYSSDLETCFLSEKTFKSIKICHPFIICGSKGSLAHLRSLGYKTFDPYIDESYDQLDDEDRLDAIVKELIKFKEMSFSEKVKLFTAMSEICIYNQQVLVNKQNDFNVYHTITQYIKKVTN